MQSILPLALLAAAVPSLVWAQARPHVPARPASARPAAQAPKSIGKFEDWQAATHQEAGQLVCYAFTRATASQPSIQGRGDVVLTVTQRTGGRDAVAISAGFAYPPSTEVQVGVDALQMPFYTANRSAFARDGKVTVVAFGRGRQAIALSPGPRNIQVSDTFSLHGFTPAYAAINKACPVK